MDFHECVNRGWGIRFIKPCEWLKKSEFEISNLKFIAENCSRQIRDWSDTLKNSGIKCERNLNEKERRQSDSKNAPVKIGNKSTKATRW
jgi:hypothetical protein